MVLSSRGVLLAAGAVASAIAGLAYGVEEFVLLATSVGVLLAVGAVIVRRRQGVSRRSLRLVVRVPVAEVATGQAALVELVVVNDGDHRLPSVLVQEPERHWALSHPGLGERRSPGGGGATGAPGAPRGGSGDRRVRDDDRRVQHDDRRWLGAGLFDTAPRRTRHDRTRDRRLVGRCLRLPELGPGADAMLRIPVPTANRGLLTLSAVVVWCEDPFRMFARRVTVAPPAHVVVYPVPTAPGHHAVAAAPRHAGHERTSGAAPAHTAGGSELSGLRPYAPGDRLTRLHWPSLARSGDLVVREFVEPEAGALTLLVDVRPAAHSEGSIEDTVARAAGLGSAALQRGVTVELCTSTGDRVVVLPDAAGRQTLFRALAMLGPADPPPAVMRRWGGRPIGGAVWATGAAESAEVVLVTTPAGATRAALPAPLRGRTETILFR